MLLIKRFQTRVSILLSANSVQKCGCLFMRKVRFPSLHWDKDIDRVTFLIIIHTLQALTCTNRISVTSKDSPWVSGARTDCLTSAQGPGSATVTIRHHCIPSPDPALSSAWEDILETLITITAGETYHGITTPIPRTFDLARAP